MLEIQFFGKNCSAEWDQFCLDSDDAWFWHTSEWLEYTIHLRPQFHTEQKSFCVKENGRMVAISPLLLNTLNEDGDEVKYFSYDRYQGVPPAIRNNISKKERFRILAFIFSAIDKIASENDVDLMLTKFSPLARSYEKTSNYLERYGFLNTSLSTSVIDLTHAPDYLLSDMRKGHRYNVKKGMEYYTVKIFDKENITREDFAGYQTLHHKAAGRMTRPQITFDLMYSWIKSGNAILAGLSYKDNYIGYSLIIVYKNGAYYGSACDDPEADVPIPLHPLLQWYVIKWLKKEEYKIYELGLQQFGIQIYDFPSEKDLSISFFKRGFGGEIVPVFSGEKFYSGSFFRKKMEQRIKKYCQIVNKS
jgi:hypothetical protein